MADGYHMLKIIDFGKKHERERKKGNDREPPLIHIDLQAVTGATKAGQPRFLRVTTSTLFYVRCARRDFRENWLLLLRDA